MKGIVYTMFLSIVLLATSCSTNRVGALFSELKSNDSYTGITVPKWLINTIDNKLIDKHTGADESLKILKNVHRVRAVYNQDKQSLDMKKVSEILGKLERNRHYAEYLTVKNDGTETHVFVKERKERIKQILFFTELGEDEVALLELKTDIDMRDFNPNEVLKLKRHVDKKD